MPQAFWSLLLTASLSSAISACQSLSAYSEFVEAERARECPRICDGCDTHLECFSSGFRGSTISADACLSRCMATGQLCVVDIHDEVGCSIVDAKGDQFEEVGGVPQVTACAARPYECRVAMDPCATYLTCDSCLRDIQCGFCGDDSTCRQGDQFGASRGACDTWTYDIDADGCR